MLMYVAVVLFVWSTVGFGAARRTQRLADGVKAGLLVGLVMMAVFDVAAILRVNLFLDLIRYREDWQNLIGRFGRSDFHSLRVYANYEYLRNTPGVVGIGAAAGALAGLLGGTAAVVGQRRRTSVSI